MNSLKLGVEVIGAHDLVAKDGQDPSNLPNLNLDACIYHFNNKSNGSKTPIGKVFVTADSSLRASNPLPAMQESIFDGFVNNTDESLTQDEIPIPASFTSQILNNVLKKKKEPVHTFHNLPKSSDGKEKKSSGVAFGMHEMKSGQSAPNAVKAFAGAAMDYVLKETSPSLGGGKVVGGRVIRPSSTYDLVEPMEYLFARVVKARDLPRKDLTGSLDPYVIVKVGNFQGTTTHFEKNQSPEWNQVFAFAKDNQQATSLEVIVKDKDTIHDDLVGTVRFDLYDVPIRVPPNSPLAPQWYRIVNKNGDMMNNGEIMLAVWHGTQADEAFPDAWHSDAMSPTGSFSANYAQIRSKVYTSPRLWYLRVKVIEAQDLVSPDDKSKAVDAFVKVQHGNQVFRTKTVQSRANNPQWDQSTLFVAAEPFEEPLIITVEEKKEIIGSIVIPLGSVEKRADDRSIRSRWYPLAKSISSAMEEGEKKMKDKEKNRPTSRQLWKKPIGVLELGILNADVQPTKTRDGRGVSDVYCVAKYGHKWVRTRTVVGSLNPKFNEQYTWEVHDPSTVLTLGVFDNAQLSDSDDSKDSNIGKVRIRLSTLETGRIYTHSYPLLSLQSSGLKKMGEVHLAIRFSCTSMTNMINLYFKPHLPKMHYTKPLNIFEQEKMKFQAMVIVVARLSRTEPPLRKEVVEYMSDTDSHLWSMRRSKANINRLKSVFSGLISAGSWLMEISTWKNSVTTVLVHILYMMLVCFPQLILPTMFLYMFIIGLWKWRFRPRYPPHMDTRLSCTDLTNPDEFDEEFDPFPTKKSQDIVRWRYDRLRSLAGRVQSVVGDIATQGERLHALLNWRDPRATTIFMLFCFVAAIVLYVIPSQILFLAAGFYLMRHPKLRGKLPPAPVNFFRRLPALTDSML
ncbi:unnamed protein product [Vicia faba]|uniref:C2 domain-containing protein n=1 Tax=Vicia faba TaxID=3906 RepID=A0AAV1ARP5_VICFA|nr:unnamed protein product [Vicia faba]